MTTLNQLFEENRANITKVFALIENPTSIIEESDFHDFCVATLDDFEAYDELDKLLQAKANPREWRWVMSCENIPMPGDWRRIKSRLSLVASLDATEGDSEIEYLSLSCSFPNGFKVWCILRAMGLLVPFSLNYSGQEETETKTKAQLKAEAEYRAKEKARYEQEQAYLEAQKAAKKAERDEFFDYCKGLFSGVPNTRVFWCRERKFVVIGVKNPRTDYEMQHYQKVGDYRDVARLASTVTRKPIKPR